MSNKKSTTSLRDYLYLDVIRSKAVKDRNFLFLKDSYKTELPTSNENTGDFWDEKFQSKEEMALKNPMEMDRNITAAKIILRGSFKRILNVGCGDGNIEKLVYPCRSNFDFYLGTDFAETTTRKLKKVYKNFRFIVDDITNSNLEKLNKFDLVCLFEVLEHIEVKNTFKTLKQIHSLLEDRGYLLISVPMNEGLIEIYPNNPNKHLRMYQEELIRFELEQSGFSIEDKYVFYAFDQLYYIKKLLAKYLFKNRWKPNNILLVARKT